MAAVLFILAFACLAAGLWLWFGGTPAAPTAEPKPAKPAKPAGKKTRRAWAEANGFAYAKTDDTLTGEWRRGAAASGAAATNVATGATYGRTTIVADLGGVTVMAMNTGETSDVVVDMRRGEAAAGGDDLVRVADVADFTVYGNHHGPVQRFIDVRVTTALENFPASVTSVWCEGDWVLAEFAAAPSAEDTDAAIAPLGLIADAARTLPPSEVRVLGVEGGVDKQPMLRPPTQLPTRTTGTARGTAELKVVGADDVDPIAEGAPATEGNDLTRARRANKPPSIF
ncbi:hypothetical protein V6D40_05355 [Corynebacterium sp. Q4381]|uniref:hypothetical protein n=1 Tax=Corynebacterium sp. Marseille-Q4381 TaxID=3121597 RepID=UPI002FE621CC